MKVELDDFGTGWVGIGLGVRIEEIELLIERLQALREGSGHFHLANTMEGTSGVADIEIYRIEGNESDNMLITGPEKPATR